METTRYWRLYRDCYKDQLLHSVLDRDKMMYREDANHAIANPHFPVDFEPGKP